MLWVDFYYRNPYPSSYAFYTILYKIIHNKDSTTFFAKGYLVINIQQLETNNTNKLTEVFCVFAFLVLTILARAKYAALVSLTSLKSYVSSSCVPLTHAFTMLGVFHNAGERVHSFWCQAERSICKKGLQSTSFDNCLLWVWWASRNYEIIR